MKDEYLDGIELMGKIGGGFAAAIAEAAIKADRENWTTLLAAFPELFNRYRDMAAKDRQNA